MEQWSNEAGLGSADRASGNGGKISLRFEYAIANGGEGIG